MSDLIGKYDIGGGCWTVSEPTMVSDILSPIVSKATWKTSWIQMIRIGSS